MVSRPKRKPLSKPVAPREEGPLDLLTPKEAAAILGVNEMTVRRHVALGTLQCTYLGCPRRDGSQHKMRFLRETLHAFMRHTGPRTPMTR